MRQYDYKKAICTLTILAINAGLFLFLSLVFREQGERFLVEHGGLYAHAVLERGEYYRFVSSLFVHFGIEHLAGNMLLLTALGYNLEIEKGHIKFLVIYFVSGIGGNIVSFWWRHVINVEGLVVSGGASGAVYGLMGAVLGTFIKHGRPIARLSKQGILIMIGISLFISFTSTGIDNAAHIGGLIFGFIIALLV